MKTVNIHDLGLIYDLSVSEQGEAAVKMTLTTPACPVEVWRVAIATRHPRTRAGPGGPR
jgi:metal-sulfur cluster biosynthetic enzyme